MLRGKTIAAIGVVGAMLMIPINVEAASAAVTGYSATTQWIGGGSSVNVRTGASVSSQLAYRLNTGSALSIECQTPGGQLGFSKYAQNRTWDRLSDGRYIHDALTTTPGGPRSAIAGGGYVAYSPGIPQCTPSGSAAASTRESRAVDYARSQLGVVSTSETPDKVWSGYCETLVEVAYGTRYRFGRAIDGYTWQRSAGRIHTDTNPPAGALVYYRWADYGHVGISIGGGQVISTQGFSTALPVRQHAVTAISNYLGWAYAPDAWTGR